MIKERQSNFELLRIVCILLILTMHSISQVQVSELSTFNVYLSHIVSSIGNIGVSCFLLISGYFGIKFKLQRFVQLAFLTTLYAVVVYLFQKGFVVDRGIVKALLVVPLYDNWFVSCYLLLTLFAPYLNDFVQNLSKIQYAKLLVIMIICFSILPTAFNTPWYTILFGGGKCLPYVIFLYLMGRFLRLHMNIDVVRSKTLFSFFVFQALILVGNISMEHLMHKPCKVLALDCSPLILGSAISMFYLFRSFCFHSKLINSISVSVLAVFLLDGLRTWTNNYIHIEEFAGSNNLVIALLCLVTVTFVLALIIDKVRILLLGGVEQKMLNKLSHYAIIMKFYIFKKFEIL